MARDDGKVTVYMRVAVHPIKAKMWERRAQITPGMTLRDIAKVIGMPKASPQKIKHHLNTMVTAGSVDFIGGEYVFPK